MTANGGECVGPPVPGGHEQQDRNQHRVRRKKEGDFAVGETKCPGDLGGKIVGSASDQNQQRRAAPGSRWLLPQGANAPFNFTTQFPIVYTAHTSSAGSDGTSSGAVTSNRRDSGKRSPPL